MKIKSIILSLILFTLTACASTNKNHSEDESGHTHSNDGHTHSSGGHQH